MKICLIALPWNRKDRPSVALGVLTAYLRRMRSQHEVVSRYEYLKVAGAVGFPLYDAIADNVVNVGIEGELIYLPHLYPEKRAEVRHYFSGWWAKAVESNRSLLAVGGDASGEEVLDRLEAVLKNHLDGLALEIGPGHDLIGLTTCYNQLFANLVLSRKIKEVSPQTRIVLGGSSVSLEAGPTILKEYPFVDYVIQGEGEQALVALTDLLDGTRSEADIPSLLSRSKAHGPVGEARLWEIQSLDELPYPEFGDYEELAEDLGIGWPIGLEGSRGCWWNRVRKTGDPLKCCRFCGISSQWGGYRQKTLRHLVSEIEFLGRKHRNLRLFFADNVIRPSGIGEFTEAIQKLGKDFQIFYELRVNVRPWELLLLKEAGLTEGQFGIEGLSTSFLTRIGKGATTIQNLQAMKVSQELGIRMESNLITDFPGSTQEEVEETRSNILQYALAFRPLRLSPFQLLIGAPGHAVPEAFGIRNIRNLDLYKVGMPEEVWRRLSLFYLDFDLNAPGADWTPVREAVQQWEALHVGRTEHLLRYRDGGSFIVIMDERGEQNLEGVFEGLQRDVYMECMEIRSFQQLCRRFPSASPEQIREALDMFVQAGLMFPEDDRFLSLAMAPSPEIAARRIRSAADGHGGQENRITA
jgi:ribosomal peptide maturation radical SAM protein 1